MYCQTLDKIINMNNKIPPPIVTLIFGLTIYFSAPIFPILNNKALDMLSIMLLILGIATLGLAVYSFKQQKTTVNPIAINKASSLVINGVFKFSRNPMYLGMVFFLLAMSAKFNVVGGILITFLFASFITKFQIIPEERAMMNLFAQDFDEYKKVTRRWI